ncbi:alpha/beta fold hydrolase [uncultured Tateyamaria sp.]|uniref:alpha/beta fold hydrolase n=1 Tax=uncultured Tateyamaria sp. TaxID=455651 RepID=UPI0026146D52|nr:alpha/beta fold hydrolase [uncultured Tateyamaria sp.]
MLLLNLSEIAGSECTMLDRSIDVHSRIKELGLEEEYPFASNFAQTAMGQMHYLDEGEISNRSTVLALHGNPSWSFLYRALVKGLSGQRRVVANDHIGFGLSDKPKDEAAYTLKAHIGNLEALVLKLDLTNITLVMQDWGGPIGLGVAARHPDRIRALVVMNTFGFYPPVDGMDPERLKLPPPLLMMRSRGLGDFMVRRLGFFERQVMTMATANKQTRAAKRAYRDIFRNPAERAGVMAFPRMIPTSTAHPAAKILLQETGPFVEQFQGPAQIFWGLKDPLIPIGALAAWKKRLPQADVTTFESARHYLQDDEPEALVRGLETFLQTRVD